MPVRDSQVLVHPGDVETEFAGVFGLEPADLQLDHHEARLNPVEEEQADVEVVVVDGEVVLAADEREPVPQFEEYLFEACHQCRFEFSFRGPLVEIEEIEDVRVADELLCEVGVLWRKMVRKIRRCGTYTAM